MHAVGEERCDKLIRLPAHAHAANSCRNIVNGALVPRESTARVKVAGGMKSKPRRQFVRNPYRLNRGDCGEYERDNYMDFD